MKPELNMSRLKQRRYNSWQKAKPTGLKSETLCLDQPSIQYN